MWVASSVAAGHHGDTLPPTFGRGYNTRRAERGSVVALTRSAPAETSTRKGQMVEGFLPGIDGRRREREGRWKVPQWNIRTAGNLLISGCAWPRGPGMEGGRVVGA